jgi:hypothetical protein
VPTVGLAGGTHLRYKVPAMSVPKIVLECCRNCCDRGRNSRCQDFAEL